MSLANIQTGQTALVMEQFLEKIQQDVNIPSKKPKVLVIHTGGTFGTLFRPHTDEEYFEKNFLLNEIKAKHPSLSFRNDSNFLENEFLLYWIFELDPLIDSANMDMKHWTLLCQLIKQSYVHFDGFVILHGTNTMEYSASALSFMIKVRLILNLGN